MRVLLALLHGVDDLGLLARARLEGNSLDPHYAGALALLQRIRKQTLGMLLVPVARLQSN